MQARVSVPKPTVSHPFARDLTSPEAISFNNGRASRNSPDYIIDVADCFARACTEPVEVLAMKKNGTQVCTTIGLPKIALRKSGTKT